MHMTHVKMSSLTFFKIKYIYMCSDFTLYLAHGKFNDRATNWAAVK